MNGVALYKRRISKFLESPQNKSFTMLGLTFITLTIFGAFAIRPTISTIITLNKRLNEGRKLEREMQTKINTLNEVQQLMYQNERQIGLSEKALPDRENMDVIIADVELVAKKYDLELVSLSPGEEIKIESVEMEALPEGVSARTISLTTIGEKENFGKFIKHLENLPRQIYVRTVSLSQDEKELRHRAEILYFHNIL